MNNTIKFLIKNKDTGKRLDIFLSEKLIFHWFWKCMVQRWSTNSIQCPVVIAMNAFSPLIFLQFACVLRCCLRSWLRLSSRGMPPKKKQRRSSAVSSSSSAESRAEKRAQKCAASFEEATASSPANSGAAFPDYALESTEAKKTCLVLVSIFALCCQARVIDIVQFSA